MVVVAAGVVVGVVVQLVFRKHKVVDVVADVNAFEVGAISVDRIKLVEVICEAAGSGSVF